MSESEETKMLNVAIIMGRLTADPELRTTASGVAVTTFSVAVDRRFQRQGEEKQTDFINVVAWRQTAEFVSRYFHRGSMIAVRGSIQQRNYEDKNGNKRTATEVIAEEALFGGSKSTGKAEEKPAESEQGGFEEVEGDPNDLPF